jgi:isocitrate dehydrogenase
LDGNEKLIEFATTLEEVVIASVEAGHMTKDLAVLVGPNQKWETTEEFLATIDTNLQKRLGQ